MQQSWRPAAVLKETNKFSCAYSKTFRDLFFHRTIPVAGFEVNFSIRKEFEKKKVNGEIALTAISLFHIKIQESAGRSATMRAFASLAKCIFTKYLKLLVNDNLNICMDECNPCGLSITGDIYIKT